MTNGFHYRIPANAPLAERLAAIGKGLAWYVGEYGMAASVVIVHPDDSAGLPDSIEGVTLRVERATIKGHVYITGGGE